MKARISGQLSPASRQQRAERDLARLPFRLCSNREKGSAILIVFVFAAIVAISLYMEMPVAVFEAKRQKEQLLIDRGNEYAHAVKLYVRKTGRYPATIEALENTNNMRFLRHRFKDPFTEKDDWRLLHAGPGGMLLDSKSTHNSSPMGILSANAMNSMSNTASFGFSNSNPSNSPFGANSTSQQSFSSGFSSSSSSSSNSQPEVVVPPVPQRPPAIAANSSGAASVDTTEGDPTQSLVRVQQPIEQTASDATANPALAQPNSAGTAGSTTQPNLPSAASAGQAADTSSATASANPPATGNAALMQNLVHLPGGAAAQGSIAGGMGQIAAGVGIAGVASKATGHTIKVVNDEDDYSKWEFYYDPRKERNIALGGMNIATTPGQTNGSSGLSQQNTQNPATQSIFSNASAPSVTTPNASPQPPTPSPQ